MKIEREQEKGRNCVKFIIFHHEESINILKVNKSLNIDKSRNRNKVYYLELWNKNYFLKKNSKLFLQNIMLGSEVGRKSIFFSFHFIACTM